MVSVIPVARISLTQNFIRTHELLRESNRRKRKEVGTEGLGHNPPTPLKPQEGAA